MDRGVWQPGDKLPSESELCAQYDVSRVVVREALGQLVAERRIYKIKAKGAYVAVRGLEDEFVGTTVGFWDEMFEKGRHLTTRVLSQEIRRPTDREQFALRIGNMDDVLALRRLRAVDGRWTLVVDTVLPAALVPGLEKINLENSSLYDTLRRRYGLVPAKADRWIEAVAAKAEEARLLEVPRGSPLLSIESIALTDDGTVMEHYCSKHRSDETRLHVRTR